MQIDALIGLILLPAIKFAGNILVANYLNKKFNLKVSVLGVAITELLLDFVIGFSLLMLTTQYFGFILNYLVLFPFRMIVWHFVLKWFYRENYQSWNKFKVLILATIWTYLIDIPAILFLFVAAFSHVH